MLLWGGGRARGEIVRPYFFYKPTFSTFPLPRNESVVLKDPVISAPVHASLQFDTADWISTPSRIAPTVFNKLCFFLSLLHHIPNAARVGQIMICLKRRIKDNSRIRWFRKMRYVPAESEKPNRSLCASRRSRPPALQGANKERGGGDE